MLKNIQEQNSSPRWSQYRKCAATRRQQDLSFELFFTISSPMNSRHGLGRTIKINAATRTAPGVERALQAPLKKPRRRDDSSRCNTMTQRTRAPARNLSAPARGGR